MGKLLTKKEAMRLKVPCEVWLDENPGNGLRQRSDAMGRYSLRKSIAERSDAFRMFFSDGRYTWNAYNRPYQGWRIWIGTPGKRQLVNTKWTGE